MSPRLSDKQVKHAFDYYLGKSSEMPRYEGMSPPWCDLMLALVMEVMERREAESSNV